MCVSLCLSHRVFCTNTGLSIVAPGEGKRAGDARQDPGAFRGWKGAGPAGARPHQGRERTSTGGLFQSPCSADSNIVRGERTPFDYNARRGRGHETDFPPPPPRLRFVFCPVTGDCHRSRGLSLALWESGAVSTRIQFGGNEGCPQKQRQHERQARIVGSVSFEVIESGIMPGIASFLFR